MVRKILLIFGSVLILAVIFLVIFLWERPQESILYVFNKTGEEVISLEVGICDSKWSHQNVVPGAEVEVIFAANCEGGILVNATLASGKMINQEIGYVTVGLTSNYRVTLTAEKLELEVL